MAKEYIQHRCITMPALSITFICIVGFLSGAAQGLCRFGNVSDGCALPCACSEGCDQETGTCLLDGVCPDGPPAGYRWHGPGCRIGNVALNQSAYLRGGSVRGLYAELAVDGNLDDDDSFCAFSDFKNESKRGMWYVDLKTEHRITGFTLVNKNYPDDDRKPNSARLGKMKIGLSNSTTVEDDTPSCYHLEHEIGDDKRETFNCSNNNVGRYFYLLRDIDGYQKHILNVCEVILDGYEILNCGSNCLSNCSELTGCNECKKGHKYPDCESTCDPGYWGDNCEESCSSGCEDHGQICNITNGNCINCKSGFWDNLCDQECGTNCLNQSCMQETGNCFSCYAGVWGLKCDKSCNVNCNQSGEVCDKSSGLCLYGCANEHHKFGSNCTFIAIVDSKTPLIAGVVSMVVLVILVGVGIFCIRRYRVKGSKESRHADTHENAASAKDIPITDNSTSKYPDKNNVCDDNSTATNAITQITPTAATESKSPGKRQKVMKSPDLPSRGKQNQGYESGSDAEGTGDEGLYENVKIGNTCIKVDKLEKYIESKQMQEGGGLREEYFRLQKPNLKRCQIGSDEQNANQNRYNNIFPYDTNRVKLHRDDDKSDYINASYIKGYKGKVKQYIASQGPSSGTVDDMWIMIWKTNTRQIVMVTQCVEQGKRKCELYWPKKKGLTGQYGNIMVTFKEENSFGNFSIRTFGIKREDHTRDVHHFHYLTWPDKTPPEHAYSIVQFRNKIRSYDAKGAGPILVHCSAGVGRTGTLIALDILLEMMEKQGMVDVFKVVTALREDRMKLVQMPGQYIFIYQALLDTYKGGNTSIPKSKFKTYFESLMDEGTYTNESGLQQQFNTFCGTKTSKAKQNTEDLVGLFDENLEKNVNKDVIPENKNRTVLFSRLECGSNYINAVFVSTFKGRKKLVVTQKPLLGTVDAFWTMVYDYKCCFAVVVNNEEDEDKDGEQSESCWWPTQFENPVIHGEIEVMAMEPTQQEEFRIRDFTVSSPANTYNMPVAHRQVTMRWAPRESVPQVKQVLSVLEMMDNWRTSSKQDGPVIIMCRDGATHSGLLAASLHLREQIQSESNIDVMLSARTVSANRPQFISNMEQYTFLYELAQRMVSEGDVYENI